MKNQAFTLIELLVVVLIIGILAAIAVPQYQLAVEKTRASEALIAVKSLKEAVDVYHLTTGIKNPSLSQLDVSLPNKFLSNYKMEIYSGQPHAQRTINGKTAYYIAFYDDSYGGYGFYCILPQKNYDTKYTKLCQSLGGVPSNACYNACINAPEADNCKDICFKLP